jgi:hypothetical protein
MSETATLPGTAEKVDAVVDAPRSSRREPALDALAALILGVVAAAVRWHVPPDGLWHDDAWQALGAWKGSFTELVTVGQTQPGFTAGLMVWTRLFGTSTASFVTPALIAGMLGPPALYLGLRRFGYARSIAFLVGAALSSAPLHIAYSYHVKTYNFDVLIVLGLALAVWHLARWQWQWPMAVAWFAGSVVVGSFSSIALIATSVAGVILVLHSNGDRRRRAAAVAAQLLLLGTIYSVFSPTYSHERIRDFFERWGGFIEFDANPVIFGREVFDHLWHVADVFPGGIPTLALALASVGLVVAALRGPQAVPARFLGLMVVVAVGGSLADVIPFGPRRDYGRLSLWLVPVMALGMCAALELVRRRVSAQTTLRTGFDAFVCIAAGVILISSFATDHAYPAGARSAVREVMADLGRNDAIVVTKYTSYIFALYSGTPVGLRATRDRSIGFGPTFGDQRVLSHQDTTTPEQFDHFVDGVDRIYLVNAPAGSGQAEYFLKLDLELALRDFTRVSTDAIETGYVEVWDRQAAEGSTGATAGGRT